MFDLTVKIDRAQARMGKLPDEVRASLKAEANDLAIRLRDRAKQTFSGFFTERTGATLKSIKKSVRSSQKSVTGRVFSASPVMKILERGARPHDIRPRNAKALELIGGRFAEAVHHPGFRGHTIINAAFQEMKGEINDGLRQAVKDGIAAADNAAGVAGA